MKRSLLELKKKLIALALTTTISVSVCGCTSGDDFETLLSETTLDGAFIAAIDEEVMIIKTYHHNGHLHYVNIVTGVEYMTDKESKKCSGTLPHIHSISADIIEYVGDLSQYMTEEEILAATNNTLTEEMIGKIVYRVLEENKNNSLKKTPNN